MWLLKLIVAFLVAVFVSGLYACYCPYSAYGVFYRTETGTPIANGFVVMIVTGLVMCYWLFGSSRRKGRR